MRRRNARATQVPPAPEILPVNRIVQGDARRVMRQLPGCSVHLIVTSPPYWNVIDYGCEGQLGRGSYTGYLDELVEVWNEAERVLVPNGKLCINTPIMPIRKSVMNAQHTRHLKNINNDIEATILKATSLTRFSLYVWQKQTTEKMFGSYPYPPNILENNTIEFINVYVKPGRPARRPHAVKEASRLSVEEWMDLTRQVWFLYPEDVSRTGGHPAPFPVLLPARLIRMYTFRAAGGYDGDIVLDMFNGTGATCVAAKLLGRRYIGIEMSDEYCALADARVAATAADPRVSIFTKRLKLIDPS
jgi:DNA modification methylase